MATAPLVTLDPSTLTQITDRMGTMSTLYYVFFVFLLLLRPDFTRWIALSA